MEKDLFAKLAEEKFPNKRGGYNESAISRKADVGKTVINEIVRFDHPIKYSDARKIAKVLGVDAWELFEPGDTYDNEIYEQTFDSCGRVSRKADGRDTDRK